MKTLIISDTHKNLTLFQGAIDHALEQKCDTLWHLGDWYDDVQNADTGLLVTYQVPGLWHQLYHSDQVSNIYTRDMGLVDCTIVHDMQAARHLMNKSLRILFHGHTHTPDIRLIGNTLLINPGHCKYERDRGYTATYLLVSFKATQEEFSAHFEQFDYEQTHLSSWDVHLKDAHFSVEVEKGTPYGNFML